MSANQRPTVIPFGGPLLNDEKYARGGRVVDAPCRHRDLRKPQGSGGNKMNFSAGMHGQFGENVYYTNPRIAGTGTRAGVDSSLFPSGPKDGAPRYADPVKDDFQSFLNPPPVRFTQSTTNPFDENRPHLGLCGRVAPDGHERPGKRLIVYEPKQEHPHGKRCINNVPAAGRSAEMSQPPRPGKRVLGPREAAIGVPMGHGKSLGFSTREEAMAAMEDEKQIDVGSRRRYFDQKYHDGVTPRLFMGEPSPKSAPVEEPRPGMRVHGSKSTTLQGVMNTEPIQSHFYDSEVVQVPDNKATVIIPKLATHKPRPAARMAKIPFATDFDNHDAHDIPHSITLVGGLKKRKNFWEPPNEPAAINENYMSKIRMAHNADQQARRAERIAARMSESERRASVN